MHKTMKKKSVAKIIGRFFTLAANDVVGTDLEETEERVKY